MENLPEITSAGALVLGGIAALEIAWRRKREITKPIMAAVLLGVINVGLTIATNNIYPAAASVAGLGLATLAAGLYGSEAQTDES